MKPIESNEAIDVFAYACFFIGGYFLLTGTELKDIFILGFFSLAIAGVWAHVFSNAPAFFKNFLMYGAASIFITWLLFCLFGKYLSGAIIGFIIGRSFKE